MVAVIICVVLLIINLLVYRTSMKVVEKSKRGYVFVVISADKEYIGWILLNDFYSLQNLNKGVVSGKFITMLQGDNNTLIKGEKIVSVKRVEKNRVLLHNLCAK